MSSDTAYQARLQAALTEMQAAKLVCTSPLYQAGRAMGLPLRPTYYLGLVAGTVHYALILMPLVGLTLWLLIWRHDDVHPISLLSPVLQISALPSMLFALLTWSIARWKRLSRWRALDGVTTDAGLTS